MSCKVISVYSTRLDKSTEMLEEKLSRYLDRGYKVSGGVALVVDNGLVYMSIVVIFPGDTNG